MKIINCLLINFIIYNYLYCLHNNGQEDKDNLITSKNKLSKNKILFNKNDDLKIINQYYNYKKITLDDLELIEIDKMISSVFEGYRFYSVSYDTIPPWYETVAISPKNEILLFPYNDEIFKGLD